jgi:low affinity Fe/Cu permease
MDFRIEEMMRMKALKNNRKVVLTKVGIGDKPLKDSFFEKFALRITRATGSTAAFIIACSIILVWMISGPFFNYSETWQLVINTSTTIITFLMVFLIQKTQNKDSLALQLKLNELVAAHEFASNRLVDVESLTEEELMTIQAYYRKLRDLTKNEHNLQVSHSIDEAERTHNRKMKARGKKKDQ